MKKIIIVITIIMTLSACDGFLDINDDPNNPTESSLQLTLPLGISGTAYVLGGEFQILGGLWSQHWTQSTGAQQYRNYDQYDIVTTDFDRQYQTLYAESLSDMEYVKKRALDEEEWNYYLISTLIQAYTFQLLADLYDQVPFTEALQTVDNFTPAFDDGQTIYDGLIERIDVALEKDLSSSTLTVPGVEDLIFSGNMDMWKAFANTLKLKMYLRQADARPGVAASGIATLFGDPEVEFLSVPARMTAFGTGQNQRNPYYETEVDRFGHANIVASNTLLGFLQPNSDPRINQLFTQYEGAFVGVDQGDFFADTPKNATETSQPIVTPTDPVYFFSIAESYFLQAEAILRFPTETGLSDADAQTFYEMGIEASFQKLGTPSTPALYGVGGPYEWTGSVANKRELIAVQKWVSMVNSQGLEAYLEQLRTGYPDFFEESVNSVLNPGEFPRRLLFPSLERDRNSENVPELEPITESVWWDVN